MYLTRITELAQSALNALLRGDPETSSRLAEMAGRCVAIDVVGTGVVLCVTLDTQAVRVSAERPDVVDVTLSGSPVALMGLLASPPSAARVRQSDISITGDVATAQRLNSILDGLDIDWEERLAQVVGDPLAHHAGRAVRGLRQWEAGTRSSLLDDVGEYLKDESRLVVSAMELGAFAAGVDRIRDDIERLDQRVRRLRVHSQGRAQ